MPGGSQPTSVSFQNLHLEESEGSKIQRSDKFRVKDIEEFREKMV